MRPFEWVNADPSGEVGSVRACRSVFECYRYRSDTLLRDAAEGERQDAFSGAQDGGARRGLGWLGAFSIVL